MNDNTKIYLGEKAAEMIAHGVDEEIKKRATNYSLCADGDGIQIDGGFGGRIFSSDLDYSTEEQLTGKRWIDGKPIYQKVIHVDNFIIGNNEIPLENLDTIINYSGNLIFTDYPGHKRVFPYVQNNSTTKVVINNYNDTKFVVASGFNCNTIDITLQYTKTTDTELSPVSLPKIKSIHNYSTDEQVVGTWIDGKPIYEKVINSGYLANNNSITIDVSHLNINDVIQLKGIAFTDDKKQFRPITLGTSDSNAIRIDFTNNNVRILTWSNWSSYNSFVIIQYTKTTD